MPDASVAEAAKPYLDYLDKEMTIQGILSAFCVAAGAAAFDRVLGAKTTDASPTIKSLQSVSFPYVVAAVAAIGLAGLFFYLQRSKLAWLHGQISFAVTHEMKNLSIPLDACSLADGLTIGNSWSLWDCYKFGMSFLAVSASEMILALSFAKASVDSGPRGWLICAGPFLVAVIVDACFWFVLDMRDSRVPDAHQKRTNSVRSAKTRRRKSLRR